MKRKNILIRKVINNKNDNRIIGIVGAHRGSGVTHTALSMAIYFSDYQGLKTALIECNDNDDFSILKSIYEWEEVQEEFMSYKNLNLFYNKRNNIILEVISSNYDKIIIDFGVDLYDNIEEFLRCDMKLILCSQAAWKRIFLIDFFEKTKTIIGNAEWLYLLPYGKRSLIKDITNTYKRKTYSIPFESDISNPSKETMNFLRELFIGKKK